MSHPRRIAGWLCIAMGFAVLVLLGMGFIDPIGAPLTDDSTTIAVLLLGLLPSVLMALAAFVLGLWLLKGARKGDRR